MKKLPDILIVLLLACLPMAMLYPLWLNPTSAGEDDVLYYYPVRKTTGQELAAGRLPIFTDREACGSAVFADPQTSIMYPTTWFFAAMEPKLAYSLSIFAAFGLAGVGAYLYLRRIGLLRPAAAFGATAFMFCGFMVGHRVHLTILNIAPLLGWGLWAIEVMRACPKKGILAMTPVVALALVGGHPQFIHVGLVWAAYFLFRARPLLRSALALTVCVVIGGLIAMPQLMATAQALDQATRNTLGYGPVGENSYLPSSLALMFYPFIYGCRTQNFFPQGWWGAWHLCEMLGYVGLATLVFAAAAVWQLRGRRKREQKAECPDTPRESGQTNPLVRVWFWIGIGIFIFMLGYYLPTYRLIHLIPVIGVVRCPARMIIGLDIALATLAAIAIDVVIRRGAAGLSQDRPGELGSSIRRLACRYLPAIMAAILIIMAIVGLTLRLFGIGGFAQPFVGGTDDMLRAVTPANPAVWTAVGVLVATMLVVRWWLAKPARRAWWLVLLVAADLWLPARFVDVPEGIIAQPDPENSPAAAFLREYAPPDAEKYRILGLGNPYGGRQNELLMSRTCEGLGFATLSNYGSIHSAAHAHLFGFNRYGTTGDWAGLVRRNYLLSMYGVRFLVCEDDSEYSEVIESVQMPDAKDSQKADGPNLVSMAKPWELTDAGIDGETLRFTPPAFWIILPGQRAEQYLALKPRTIYRLSMDVRSPGKGAANFVQADIFQRLAYGQYIQSSEMSIRIEDERITPQWRHHQVQFITPGKLPTKFTERTSLRIFTFSERPIEVRNITLFESQWDQPVVLSAVPSPTDASRPSADPSTQSAPASRAGPQSQTSWQSQPARPVYWKLAVLPSQRPGQKPVAIYENILFDPSFAARPVAAASEETIERWKWRPDETILADPLPDLSIRAGAGAGRRIRMLTLPAIGIYVCLAAAIWIAGRNHRQKREGPPEGW
ncbi:MAG: hypothetical protein HZA50_07075 [Planctomycetes bacterium]|nr:hypothetical protein [Planctomycetota bacterium]